MSELRLAERLTRRDFLPDVREKARWRHKGVGEDGAGVGVGGGWWECWFQDSFFHLGVGVGGQHS